MGSSVLVPHKNRKGLELILYKIISGQRGNTFSFLGPGGYIGAEDEEEDEEVFVEKIDRLTSKLVKQMEDGKKLDQEIIKNLANIGFKI